MENKVKLWTLQTTTNYEKIKGGEILFSTAPDNLLSTSQEWFLNKIKSKRWPIWAYINNPNKNTILNFCEQQLIESENKPVGVLLELNIPNNEKMIFIKESAWEYVNNYLYLGSDKETSDFQEKCRNLGIDYFNEKPLKNSILHQEIINSWNHIFDLQWCSKNIKTSHKEEQMLVCIQAIHPKWVENTYLLTPRVLENSQIYLTNKKTEIIQPTLNVMR